MPKCRQSAAGFADVCARLLKGETPFSIRKATGMGDMTLTRMAAALRAHGLQVRARPKSVIDPVREAALHEMFRTTLLSNREIAARTGNALTTVSNSRTRFNKALVAAGGQLPRCECGQYLHHARLCFARTHRVLKAKGVASVRTLARNVQEDIKRRLLAGETARSIAERVNLEKSHVQSFLRSFTAEERRQREDAFRICAGRRRAATLQKRIARPHATSPASDPLYARISAAVPRGIDPALRDDMISQAYLDVLEGRLKEEHLAQGVRKVRGRMFQAFANPWGNVSLDAVLDDDGGRAMIERIPANASAFI